LRAAGILMQHFTSNGVDIAYVDIGEGKPILLIHGFGSNYAVNWQATGWISTLTNDGRRVVAMDVRGHGQSAKLYTVEAYSPALMADDAANFIRHVGIAPTDVMGYSMGGRISAMLAVRHPELVRTLIIGGMGINVVEGIGGEAAIAEALEAPSLEDVTTDVGRGYRIFADQTRSDRAALAKCIFGQRQRLTAAEVATIRAPTLVAVGTKDDVAGSPHRLAALIPGAEVLEIEGRDHMLATGDRRYKAGVLDFLARHP
jgi:pimeloyl-ACP methyl ester carboxylesterase